jgi:ABC-2 type transport system permease protein
VTTLGPARRRGGPRNGGPSAFPEAVSGEWAKIRTVPSTYWTLLAGLVLSAGLTVVVALAVTSDPQISATAARTRLDPAAYSLVGLSVGALPFGVLGVLSITGEYATGAIRVSLAAIPRRRDLLAAKAMVLAAITVVAGEVTAFGSFLAGQVVYRSRGLPASLADPGVLRAVVGGGVYLMLVALLAFGVGIALRRTAGSVATVIGILFVLPVIATTMSGGWGTIVNALLPSNAGGAILSTRAAHASLSPWSGLGLFALYTLVMLGAGTVLFERRDM